MIVKRGGSPVPVSWWFVKQNRVLVRLTTMISNDLFRKALIIPKAVVYDWLLSRFSSGSICTSPLVSVATSKLPPDRSGRFPLLEKRASFAAYYSVIITTWALFFFLGFSVVSLAARMGTCPEMQGTIFRPCRKMSSRNLSMNKALKTTGTSSLRTALRTNVTLVSHFPTKPLLARQRLSWGLMCSSEQVDCSSV